MQRKAVGRAVLLAIVLVVAIVLPSTAGSTGKSLSTNFTLINLGDQPASGTVQYIKPDGGQWKADDTLPNVPAGGQVIYRQYTDGSLSSGSGSVIVNADQQLGAVVQILARNQIATSGAYIGFSDGSEKAYVPLVMSKLTGASGLVNSQIVVQNAGTAATDVTVDLRASGGSPATLSKKFTAVAPGASVLYDLADESGLNAGWYGSAIISATTGNKIVAVSNLFTGSNGMQTFNAFTAGANSWLVPLFTSRLGNGLSTPLAIQNLSAAPIAANDITISCNKNLNGPDPATLTIKNPSEIAVGNSFNVNPVTDLSIPAGWYGSCRITSASGAVVAFVQMRKVGTDQAAAYEAINANSTDKQVLVPLAAKRLTNQFATVTTIQNVSTSAAAHVTFTYIPSQEYITAGGSPTPVVIGPVEIPAGGSIQHNLRLASGPASVAQLPDGWYGTTKIVSSDQPINGIVELTFLSGEGDTYQAHNVFTKP